MRPSSPPRMMQGHPPLTGVDEHSAVGAYAEHLLIAPVEERNAFANAMLAWAEDESADTFARLRHAVFEAEMRQHAKHYEATFRELGADHNHELGVAKLRYLLVRYAQAKHGEGVSLDTYEAFFGPDIPQTVARIYDKGLTRLMGAAQDPRGAG